MTPPALRTIPAALAALCLGLWLAVLSPAWAQELDYDSWTTVADRAEEVIDRGQASTDALEELRSTVAGWRDTFLAAESTNAPRIQTLQQQISALGDPPAEGEGEAPDIASRRADLNAQLAELQAPVKRAEEAYTRADGIIREIDGLIRTRQTDALLELGPSPLNPALWPGAVEAVLNAGQNLWHELRSSLQSDAKQAQLRNNLPVIGVLVVLALWLVVRGPHWVRKLGNRLRHKTRRGTGFWRFVVSLGRVLLPFFGLVALTAAARATGLAGINLQQLLNALPVWGLVLLIISWLAEESFHRDESIATIPLPEGRRREARVYANVLAFLLVLRSIGEVVAQIYGFDATTSVVLDFPILILCALMLFRLGQILSTLDTQEAGDGALLESSQFRKRLVRLLGQGAMVFAVVGPTLSAIGYDRVGEAMVYPAVSTLAVLALVLVLQRAVADLYELIAGKSANESDSLLPVLVDFVLVVAAMPALALVWGARVADLTELWTRFQEGFVFGETRISPTSFLTMLLVFLVGLGLTRLLQGGLRSSVLPRTKLDVGGQNAIVSGFGYVGIVLAAVIAISAAGLDLSSLAIVAGALSVGVGFGLQTIVSNFVSGIILLIERPISEGDWIDVGGNQGIVKDISVRATRIETFDRTDLIVPNSDFISGTVTNYTRSNVLGRVVMTVGVAYGTDTRRVEDILRRIVREHEMVLLNPEPMITFEEFGADSLNFVIRAVIHDVGKKLIVLSDFHHEIARRFAEEEIEIPFAQRDVWLRNPEVLFNKGQGESAPAPADPDGETEKSAGAKREEAQSATGSATMAAGRDGDGADD